MRNGENWAVGEADKCERKPRLEMVTFLGREHGNYLSGKRRLPKWSRNRSWNWNLTARSQPGKREGETGEGGLCSDKRQHREREDHHTNKTSTGSAKGKGKSIRQGTWAQVCRQPRVKPAWELKPSSQNHQHTM